MSNLYDDIDRILARARPARAAGRWSETAEVLSKLDPLEIQDPERRYAVVHELFLALLHTNQHERCLRVLQGFAQTPVPESLLRSTDRLLSYLRDTQHLRLVATFDANRLPHEDELVICYGDYPLAFTSLLCHNPVFRHLKYFWEIDHSQVEYDHLWDPVAQIYIVNLHERFDRQIETLRELKRMQAPFCRVTRFPACRDTTTESQRLNGYIGCTKSHLEVINDVVAQGYKHTLILEDDFCFVDPRPWNRRDLQLFFERQYDYHVCLLAASNSDRLVPHDDLLSRIYQEGTTTSGYLVSAAGARKVQQIWSAALERLLATGETHHIADQSWATLQEEDRFFVFTRKLGFQRPGQSCITGEIVFDLD